MDFLVAGFRNTVSSSRSTSTVGQRDQFQLPTRSINGGTEVNHGTTTYNAAIAQNVQ